MDKDSLRPVIVILDDECGGWFHQWVTHIVNGVVYTLAIVELSNGSCTLVEAKNVRFVDRR